MDVPCPHCKETLLRIRPIAENATGIHQDDPHMEHEDGEYFVTCPHCDNKVLMESVPEGPSGISFRVKPNQ